MDMRFSKISNLSKRHKLLALLAALFLSISLIYGLYWLFLGRFYLYTNNGYVGGNLVQLMPQVTGVVTGISVDDTDFVREGQLLVKLDDTDARVNLQNAQANLAEQVRQVIQYYTHEKVLKSALILAKAELTKAEQELKHRTNLIKIAAVSAEELNRVKVSVVMAITKEKETLHQLQAASALIRGTSVANHPMIQVAAAKVRIAYLNFMRTKLVAPVTGYVAKRTVQPGQQVTPSTPLLVIVPLNEIWIDANFKESDLRDIRIGQPVTVISDVYGSSIKFKGKVAGISPGTGTVFSLLPPQNASGNWIKILQRLPVRVTLDADQLIQHPLRVGMSTQVTINIRNLSGKVLATIPRKQMLYNTDIYNKQLAAIDTIINKIIHDNTFL